jgi:hypothetical protein
MHRKHIAQLLLVSLLISRLAPEVAAQNEEDGTNRPQALGLLKKITGVGDKEVISNVKDIVEDELEEEEEDGPKESIAHVRLLKQKSLFIASLPIILVYDTKIL